MRWLRSVVALPLVMSVAGGPIAQDVPGNEVTELPPHATLINEVLVPVPKEIFKTLDTFAHSNWRTVQRPQLAEWRSRGNQTQLAMLLGAVIAEGFIAVEAEDAGEVKSLGRAVLTLSRGLGVEKAALRRSRSIVEHAERGDWEDVRREWDGVLPDVQQGMRELKSEELAHYVSLGGWLRGVEAMSALLLQDYSPERATILRQPTHLAYFEKQLTAQSADNGAKAMQSQMRDAVAQVGPIVQKPEASQADVKSIGAISADLLKQLNAGGPSP